MRSDGRIAFCQFVAATIRETSVSKLFALSLSALGTRITPELASCVYAALLTDTGSFHFSNTTERTFKIASELVRRGVKPASISQALFYSYPFSKIKMLGMALFKSLVKQHGTQYFEPVGKTLAAAGMKTFSPANPMHVWKLRKALLPYGRWWLGELMTKKWRTELGPLPEALRDHAIFAIRGLQSLPLEISAAMRKHQLKLADRQCRMSQLSTRVQRFVVMLATSLYAAKQNDEVVRAAADVICQDLARELTGSQPNDRYFRAVNSLGASVAEGKFASIAGLTPDEILMKYDV